MFFDWTIIILIPTAIFAFIAQAKVNSTFQKFAKVQSAKGLTGAQAAREILDRAGVNDVSIERISGNLTDHYDPSAKVLRLSDAVHDQRNIAAIGVAAHECGHAIQHDEGYIPLTMRNSIYPVVNISTKASTPLILIGLLLGAFTGSPYGHLLAQLGVLLFAVVVAFQLITLPVEFNASSRAVAILGDYGLLSPDETPGVKKVLGAAALTYVAALGVAIANLIRLIYIVNRRGDR